MNLRHAMRVKDGATYTPVDIQTLEKIFSATFGLDCGITEDIRTAERLSPIAAAHRIMTNAQYDQLKAMTKKVAGVVKDALAQKGLDLYDIKFEFGFYGDDVILIDEIASGNMRVYKDGHIVDPIDLTALVLGE